MVYESIIVGGGPAGITAGVYLARKKINFLMLSENIGGQTLISGNIENYIGYQYITGPALAEKFAAHLKDFNIELREERVDKITKSKGVFSIFSNKGEYRAQTVIICTGRQPRELNVPGEKEFKNKGMTYCAICDGPLFAGKNVAIIGGGNGGVEVALQMSRIAKKLYLVEKTSHLTADKVLIEKLSAEGTVEVLLENKVTRIYGDNFLSGISVADESGKEKQLAVEGVFIEIGSVPNSFLVEDTLKNEWGEVMVDCAVKTSLPGLFAAGDVTNVYKKQIIIACGEGAKAAIAASEYLYYVK